VPLLVRSQFMLQSLLFIFFLPSIYATELKPWYPRYLELQPKMDYLYQVYHSVATKHGHKNRNDHDHFLKLSTIGALDRYSAEIEMTGAATRHRNFGLADIRFTGRYQLSDDTLGDHASVTTGLTIEQVLRLARNDVSNFYHGGIQFEGHLAVGKETVCGKFWRTRIWGVGAIGAADIGSAWLRFNLGWEYNLWDLEQIGFYAYSRWGLGGKGLRLKHFRGYGPIQHQSIDLLLECKHQFSFGGILGFGYGYRVYAANCPRYVNFFHANFCYPFGL
jgi:hypothetical protein